MDPESSEPSPSRRAWRRVFGEGSFGRYGLLGFTGIAVDVVAYGVFIALGLMPLLATLISSFLGVVTNYLANATLNFRVPLRGGQAVKFVTVGLTGLLVAAGILQLAVILGAGPWWAKIISLVLVVPVQFLVNRSWTFR
jgi:putative flippase GtrA